RKINLVIISFPFNEIVEEVAKIYKDIAPELAQNGKEIAEMFSEESHRFEKALNQGIKELEKSEKIDAKIAFYIFESFGLPYEVIKEIADEKGQKINQEDFEQELKKHQKLSKGAAEHVFRGGLVDQSYQVTKYHTATHLLHQALRQVLGDRIRQEGSNITSERLRFDFNYDVKLTLEQIKKIEEIVNEKIKENLPVLCEVTDKEEAFKSGALGFFRTKYGDKVRVYTIGNPLTSKSSGPPFSREICGGPHVNSTGELGVFKIIKEDKVARGIRRIKAILSTP
ncbi:MAG: alanine--tRNA ligase, partial [Parcubacteria group bacterium CG_4_10_14_0_2_um_filter_7_35_8]